MATPRRRKTVAVSSAKCLQPVRVVAGDAQRQAVHVDLGVTQEVPQPELVVAGPHRGIRVHGHLEGPDRERRAVRPEARGGVRETGLQAAGRKTKRGVAHGAEGYRPMAPIA